MSTFALLQVLDHFELFITDYQHSPTQRFSPIIEQVTLQRLLFQTYTLLRHTLQITGQDIPYFDGLFIEKYSRINEQIKQFYQ